MRDAVDFETPPDPQTLADLGLDALVYTGNARPSQAWVDRARALDITVTFVQETVSTRSQQGFQAGVYDCQFAESRARELGHAGSIAYVVSDGSWVDAWDCSDYGRGVQSVATLPFFAYGSTGCCETFNRGAPKSLGTWIPETWGAGTLLTQVVGSSPIPGTDLNHVHADYTGTVPTPPSPPKPKRNRRMFLVQTESRYYLVCYPTIEPGTGDLATGDLASFAANGVPLLVRSEAWITTEQAVFAAHAGSSGAGIPVNVETIAQGVTQGIKAL